MIHVGRPHRATAAYMSVTASNGFEEPVVAHRRGRPSFAFFRLYLFKIHRIREFLQRRLLAFLPFRTQPVSTNVFFRAAGFPTPARRCCLDGTVIVHPIANFSIDWDSEVRLGAQLCHAVRALDILALGAPALPLRGR